MRRYSHRGRRGRAQRAGPESRCPPDTATSRPRLTAWPFPYLIDPSLHWLFLGLVFYANPVPLGKRLIYLNGVELPIVQLHFYRPAPHRQLHVDLVGVFRVFWLADLLDLALHVLEGAVADLDPITHAVRQLLRCNDDRAAFFFPLLVLRGRLFGAAEHRLYFAV